MSKFNEFKEMWDYCTDCGKAVVFSFIQLPSGKCHACHSLLKKEKPTVKPVDEALDKLAKKYNLTYPLKGKIEWNQ